MQPIIKVLLGLQSCNHLGRHRQELLLADKDFVRTDVRHVEAVIIVHDTALNVLLLMHALLGEIDSDVASLEPALRGHLVVRAEVLGKSGNFSSAIEYFFGHVRNDRLKEDLEQQQEMLHDDNEHEELDDVPARGQ